MNTPDLPKNVVCELERFIDAAKSSWGEDLRSVVLYGSAAEGRLRSASDVNLLLILRRFDRKNTDTIREVLRSVKAAIRLGVMFLLEEELNEATKAFAVKFDDIRTRHRVLYGYDPFEQLEVSPAEALAKTRQMLMNMRLRLRERYASLSLREEELTRVIVEIAGPLRACAATIYRIQGFEASNPKQALEALVSAMKNPAASELLELITEARIQEKLKPGAPGDAIFLLMDLIAELLKIVSELDKDKMK